ncbi:uncharacterized protein LOC111252740 [Varroa destructor]|uniref:Uncharacterized protein n=1 Tax=Varroa destructor TaxID=109461 RepID=A0A7M7KH79_VARDE|nr:uncharacterized protein LOC111252740 [Varroa destructor]
MVTTVLLSGRRTASPLGTLSALCSLAARRKAPRGALLRVHGSTSANSSNSAASTSYAPGATAPSERAIGVINRNTSSNTSCTGAVNNSAASAGVAGAAWNSSSSRLGLFTTALAPGLAFGVLAIVAGAFHAIPEGALVPSLLVGAVAALLSGFCYSELVTHVTNPQRETCLYQLLYQCVGEFPAFSAGWAALLHRLCAVALCCRLLAPCLDQLGDHSVSNEISNPIASGGFVAALLVIPCALLVTIWFHLADIARARAWLSGLLLGAAAFAEGVYLLAAGLLWHSPVQPIPPPGGRLGASLASNLFGGSNSQHESTGLMTGAALCVSIFLAPQFSVQGFPLAPVSPRQNGAPSPQIRPARDLPCVAVLSTFLNFLFAFALIAVMCALRQRSVDVPGVLASGLETIALSNSGTDPLAVVRLAVSVFRRHAAYANLAITALSAFGLTLLALLNMADLSAVILSFADDGLLPSPSGRLKGLPLAAALAAVGAILLRPAQLATAMAAGPLLLNAIICICVLAMRSCTRRNEDQRYRPAVFSYNLIIGGSKRTNEEGSSRLEGDRAPILSREEQCVNTPSISPEMALTERLMTTMGFGNGSRQFVADGESDVEYDRGVEGDRGEDIVDDDEEEEDIDDIVKEYKSKQIGPGFSSYSYSHNNDDEDQKPILPPRNARSQRPSNTASSVLWRWRAELCLAGLLACFITLSALLEALSTNYALQRPAVASALVVAASITALSALAFLFALARQEHQQLQHQYKQQQHAFGMLHMHQRLTKFGKLGSNGNGVCFRVPMSPCLPALGAFLNILAFVDLFASNVVATVSLWFVSGCLLYVLYGAHHSMAPNALPCSIVQREEQTPAIGPGTEKTPSGNTRRTDDVRATLEPLPIYPWNVARAALAVGASTAGSSMTRVPRLMKVNPQSVALPAEMPEDIDRRRGANPFNPVENIIMKR